MLDRLDDPMGASMRIALRRGDPWSGPEHLLLAILERDRDGPSGRALGAAGVTSALVEGRLAAMTAGAAGDRGAAGPTPRLHQLVGMARGLALGADAEPSDVHALLALVYDGLIGELAGIDGIERVTSSLRDSSVPVPSAAPPGPLPPPQVTSRIYYPVADHAAVTIEMSSRFPPPDGPAWGFNLSAWKKGYHWLDADDACGAGRIVRAVAGDAGLIIELPLADAVRFERAASR